MIRNYLEFVKESSSLLVNLSDDDLRHRLDGLRIELNDISSEMSEINRILINRKENSEEDYASNFPDNIFDMNKDQLNFIFEHHHGTSKKHYQISRKYLSQLNGVMDNGFNSDTNQFKFTILSSYSFNESEDGFELIPQVVKSIKFLGDNLKKVNGYVNFGVQYYYNEDYNDFVLYGEDIKYNFSKVKDIETLLECIVDNDLMERKE